ncbi:hypothetical protein [Treponema sp.]|uniref:hypothetical protein n=1 Tax=Treponema sp. TaxID=166 RepID=UPI003F02BFE6
MSENNIQFETQSLAPLNAGIFPENIFVEIPADKEAQKNDTNKSGISEVFFVFSHEFFMRKKDFALDFIEKTHRKKLPYNCTIVFTADNENFPLPSEEAAETATEQFAKSLFSPENSCAVLVRNEEKAPPVIFTEGAGSISPQWIVQAIKKSCQQNQKPMGVKSSMLYIYKPQYYRNNRRLSAFLANEIPAAELPLGHKQKDLNTLSSIQDNLVFSRTQNWNKHYNFIPAGISGFWLNEAQLTSIYLAFTVFTLFFICFYSFASTGKNEAVLKDMSMTWFTIPVYVLAASFFLSLFQGIFHFTAENGIVFFMLKSFFSMLTVFFAIFVQFTFRFRISLHTNRLHAIIISALNIFIFSSLDLSLMFIFIIEYMTVFIFRKRQHIFFCILCIFLMTLPLLWIITSVFIDIQQSRISDFAEATFLENFIFSFAILPFAFQWIKILFVTQKKNDTAEKKTRLVRGLIVSAAAAGAICLLFFAAAEFMKKTFQPAGIKIHSYTEKNEEPPVRLAWTKTQKAGLADNTMEITPEKEFKILRCLAVIETDSAQEYVPFYECNFDYEMKDKNTVSLKIPDAPENGICINFISGSSMNLEARLEFFMASPGGEIFKFAQTYKAQGNESSGT